MKSRTWMWMSVMNLFATLAFALLAIQSAQAQTFSVIYNFTGGSDGAKPYAGLTIDAAGNLYGTASAGGAGYGTVFKLKHKNSSWLLTPLYIFQGGNDGDGPEARVIIGPNGSLYGTTSSGGRFGAGSVFNLRAPVAFCKTPLCPWTESVLYSFTDGLDGGSPLGDLVFDQEGNFYGTTSAGGYLHDGTVFKVDTLGNETVLHSFNSTDGADPRAGLIKDEAGNLYGTTLFGGRNEGCPPVEVYGCGTVFKVDATGTLTDLYRFSLPPDAIEPSGNLVLDKAGNLYGTTTQGGSGDCFAYSRELGKVQVGCGTVFKLDSTGGQETVLYSFLGGSDKNPLAGLVLDAAGNLYGTTYGVAGGDGGTVFKVDASGNETVLYRFTGGSDGANPSCTLAFDAKGNLYGTTQGGGANGHGVVFEITP